MNKGSLIAIVFILMIIMSSCSAICKKSTTSATPVLLTPTPVKTSYPTPVGTPPTNGIVFQNEKDGYQLTFPETWQGWYRLDVREDSVGVWFLGKSQTGKKHVGDDKYEGIPMFTIIQERGYNLKDYDNIIYIGKVKGVNYFYGTGTSNNFDVLQEIANGKKPERWYRDYEIDEKEIQLAKQDLEKVNRMKEEINSILASFREIQVEVAK